jgi:valyl-tRNA synthetase
MPADQGGRTILFAPWPKPLGEDFFAHYGIQQDAVESMNARFDLVSQGRNMRQASVPGNKKLKFVLRPAGNQAFPGVDLEILRLLLNAESIEVDGGYAPPKGTPVVHSPLGDLFLPLSGLIDPQVERARLAKELEKAAAEVAKAEQKLNNPQFVEKVPPPVLAEHQKRLADWRAKRDQLATSLASLG